MSDKWNPTKEELEEACKAVCDDCEDKPIRPAIYGGGHWEHFHLRDWVWYPAACGPIRRLMTKKERTTSDEY